MVILGADEIQALIDRVRATAIEDAMLDVQHAQECRYENQKLREALKEMMVTFPYRPLCYGWQEQRAAHKQAKEALGETK